MSVFPWTLSSKRNNLGIGGVFSPNAISPTVLTPVVETWGDMVVSKIITKSTFDLALKALTDYILDGVLSVVLSTPGDADLSGSTGISKILTPYVWPSCGANQDAISHSSLVTLNGTSGATYSGNVPWRVDRNFIFQSFVNTGGSLREALTTYMTALINAANSNGGPSATMPIYSTHVYETSTYVRNANNWVIKAGLDFTGLAVENNGSPFYNPALISEQMVITAAHVNVYTGQILKFMAQDGTVYSRTVSYVGTFNDPDTGAAIDLGYGILNSPLPSTIRPFRLLPKNWALDTMPSVISFKIPYIQLAGRLYNAICPCIGEITSPNILLSRNQKGYSQASAVFGSLFEDYFYALHIGDSASLSCIPNPSTGDLCLFGTATTASTGSHVSGYADQLQAVMDSEYAAGHTANHNKITVSDFSMYNQYGYLGADTTLAIPFTLAGSGFTYQWAKNGTNISGATSATLTLSNLGSGDAGTYRLTVTNSVGATVQKSTVLIVN